MNESYQRLADYMNFSPSHPETWPLKTFDWLLAVEKYRGRDRMHFEIMRMMTK